jgi:DNA-binding HxlR family transcriptional regulator
MAKREAAARGSILSPGQIFCPVGRALDVIGDRWTLGLIRQLLGGPLGFQELRARTGIAPRVLAMRLRALAKRGFVSRGEGARAPYVLSERGRTLEPVITAMARWYLRHGLDELQVDANRFSATSARSVLESLPFLLREERAAGVDLTFEIRLTGLGGGVWTVHIQNGTCTVREGFAERADVRYTADARVWCGVALGIADARAVHRGGLMSKDGGREALDFYFHQIGRQPGHEVPPRRQRAEQTRRPPALPAAGDREGAQR